MDGRCHFTFDLSTGCAISTTRSGAQPGDRAGFGSNANVKLFHALSRLMLEVIPQGSCRDEHRQGGTLGLRQRNWGRARIGRRFSLSSRYDPKAKLIVQSWVNGRSTLRSSGSMTDPHAVLANMLARGNPPDDRASLMTASRQAGREGSSRFRTVSAREGEKSVPGARAGRRSIRRLDCPTRHGKIAMLHMGENLIRCRPGPWAAIGALAGHCFSLSRLMVASSRCGDLWSATARSSPCALEWPAGMQSLSGPAHQIGMRGYRADWRDRSQFSRDCVRHMKRDVHGHSGGGGLRRAYPVGLSTSTRAARPVAWLAYPTFLLRIACRRFLAPTGHRCR